MKSGSATSQAFKNYILSAYYVLNSGYTAVKTKYHPQGTYILEQADNKQVGKEMATRSYDFKCYGEK